MSTRRPASGKRTLTWQVQAGLSVVLASSLVVCFGMLAMSQFAARRAQRLANQSLPLTLAMQKVSERLAEAQLGVTETMLGYAADDSAVQSALGDIGRLLGDARQSVSEPVQKRVLAELTVSYGRYRQGVLDLFKAAPEDRSIRYASLQMLFTQFSVAIQTMASESTDMVEQEAGVSISQTNGLRIAAVAVLLGFMGTSLFVSRRVRQSLARVTRRVGEATGDIENRALETADAAGRLALSTRQVSEAMSQVARSVEQVTIGSNLSAASAQGISTLMSQIHEAVQAVAESASRVQQDIDAFYDEVARASRAVHQGRGIAGQAGEAIEANLEAEQGVSMALGRLAGEVEKITGILGEMNNVSAQTELLSLNASIEAARAGEFGRGFAIVAEEIRKLSVQTATSSGQIGSIMEHINEVNAQVISEINRNLGASQTVIQHAASLKDSFLDIAGMVTRLESLMGQLTEAARREFELTGKSLAISERIHLATGEIAAQAEQVSASMQELGSTVEEVVAANEEMRETAGIQAEMAGQLSALSSTVAEEMKNLM